MTRKRQTFFVAELRDYVNAVLDRDHLTDEQRLAVALTLEHVLHETGNYRGYGYKKLVKVSGLDQYEPENETQRRYF